MQTHFADAAINISMTGSLVRIDFGTVVPAASNDAEKREVKVSQSHQLVMPLEGFLRLYGMQEQVVKKLIADGVIKQGPTANQGATGEMPGSGLVS
jgi:hypothetical protein